MSNDSRKDLRERGLAIRRQVLGDKYVDMAMNNGTDFNRPLKELLNEYCWPSVASATGRSRTPCPSRRRANTVRCMAARRSPPSARARAMLASVSIWTARDLPTPW
jgi:hypothetical protein